MNQKKIKYLILFIIVFQLSGCQQSHEELKPKFISIRNTNGPFKTVEYSGVPGSEAWRNNGEPKRYFLFKEKVTGKWDTMFYGVAHDGTDDFALMYHKYGQISLPGDLDSPKMHIAGDTYGVLENERTILTTSRMNSHNRRIGIDAIEHGGKDKNGAYFDITPFYSEKIIKKIKHQRDNYFKDHCSIRVVGTGFYGRPLVIKKHGNNIDSSDKLFESGVAIHTFYEDFVRVNDIRKVLKSRKHSNYLLEDTPAEQRKKIKNTVCPPDMMNLWKKHGYSH